MNVCLTTCRRRSFAGAKMTTYRRLFTAALLLALATALLSPQGLVAPVFAQESSNGPSGLPVPRFVSLKSNRINVRGGPSRSHAVKWVFARVGLPVEIIAESENWRRVRDSEGEEGWVYHSLLSGRRTALVAPWSKERTLPMHAEADDGTRIVALLEPGVVLDVRACDSDWCKVTVTTHNGYFKQDLLWGVYPKETFE